MAETEADSAYGAYLQAQQAYEQSLKSEVQALERAGLNFGWEPAWFNSLWARFHADWSGALLTLLMKLSGLLVTAAALTLGAPFWFDQLQKFAQIRSVGLSPVERRTAENKQQATAAAKD